MTRCTLYILLSACIVLTFVFVWQGVPQNLNAYTDATTLEGAKHVITQGPVASQETIKILGANGGGRLLGRRAHADQLICTRSLKITAMELIKLAPRLKPYLNSQAPSWPEIVDAADWLRDEMGISKFIWGDACLVMGREQAAIAVAVVSAKPPTHFRGSPGGYFHGMVSKAKAGELHLARTIWGMRGAGERHLK
jgi:Replication protein C C-terminal region/Potassium-transporting ATPase A subunit